MHELRIGISGWRYAGWRGVFYPEGLRQRDELAYASRRLNSIEINGSFYALQRPASYARWAEDTPADFRFAVKGSRYITHMRRLREVLVPLANFFASGLLGLGAKLGPVLWQFPANFAYDHARFEDFLAMLPRTTGAAAALARAHASLPQGRAAAEAAFDAPLRHAFEVRNAGFFQPAFLDLLRGYGAALVIADTAETYPYAEEVTADLVYARLHGAHALYQGSYDDAALDAWADKIRAWLHHRDVHVYFDNDVKARAPFDALRLASRLGIEPAGEPPPAPREGDLPAPRPEA